MRIKQTNYLYNFHTEDDGPGSPIIIDIGGFKVQIGINVAIMPGFHILPCPTRVGQITIVGSNSFLGNGESLEEGSVSKNGTILLGKPLFEGETGIRVMLVGDDFGRRSEANACMLHCFQQKIIHHASLMINCSSTKDAVKTINEYNLGSQIGLHFNVQDGDAFVKNKNETHYDVNVANSFAAKTDSKRSAFFLTAREKKILKEELEQQIQAIKAAGIAPRYFDSHGNIHFKWPIAKSIYKILIREGFEYVRVPRNVPSRHKVYDFLFKRRVTKLYRKHFKTSDEFLYASDLFSSNIAKHNNRLIEVMVHPFVNNGRFVNRRDVDFFVLLAYFKACGITLVTKDY